MAVVIMVALAAGALGGTAVLLAFTACLMAADDDAARGFDDERNRD